MKQRRQRIWTIALLAGVMCLAGCVREASQNQSIPYSGKKRIYDVYEKGIRRAEMTIDDGGSERTYTIRRKDVRSLEWSEPVISSDAGLAENEEFQLWGSISALPSLVGQIEGVGWGMNRAVGWPDENSLYVRHRKVNASVDGKNVTAYFWGLVDGVSPMDFIISPDNVLIAGLDPSADFCMVLRGYEDFTILKEWRNPQVSQAKHGYRFLGKFMVPMDDGVRLATAVYLPDDGRNESKDVEGKNDVSYPVMLVRTQYGISPEQGNNRISNYYHYCARGYAVVLQATRGSCPWDPPEWRSEGKWEMCINEPKDGADCLDWIVNQPWCDGNIGMQGGSYVAHTQWTAAMSGNPALKAIIPESCFATAWGDMPYMGGGYITSLASFLIFYRNLQLKPGITWDEIMRHRPLIEIDTFATGVEWPTWNAYLEHSAAYDDYWAGDDWFRPEVDIDVAALHISGWFDDDFPGTRAGWELMKRKRPEHQRLLLGAWKHGYNRHRSLNEFSFGIDVIRDDVWLLKQKWYDRFLKGIDNGVEDTRVEYFMMGENRWVSDSQWPPEESELRKWYFHSSGKAHSLMTDGKLMTDTPAIMQKSDIYQYDPQDPPPNWMSYEQLIGFEDVQSFPYNFKDIDKRHDVAVYTSAPLEEDVAIAGDLMAVLYASCDVRDTDWWIRVEDVDEKGDAMSIAVDVLRARFRELDDPWFHVFGSNFEKVNLLSGDFSDVIKYEIRVHSIAATFKKGHKIRIAVMNACDNYLFPNSNTGGNEAFVTKTVVGKMAIHHSEKYPSHIMLPVLRN